MSEGEIKKQILGKIPPLSQGHLNQIFDILDEANKKFPNSRKQHSVVDFANAVLEWKQKYFGE